MTDDEINNSSDDLKSAFDLFADRVTLFEEGLKVVPELGHAIIVAATKTGYDPQNHGRFSFWLFDYLGRWIKSHQPILHTDDRLVDHPG